MRSLLPLSLLALAVSAEAASHRLAYSKAESVEVFVDHADSQPWCSPNLQLRFAFAGAADTAAVERLLPKLGGLLGSQCPSATQLSWHSTDSSAKRVASGTASQAGGWIAQLDAPVPAAAPAVTAAASVPAAAGSAPAPNVAAETPAASVAETEQAAPAAPAGAESAAQPVAAFATSAPESVPVSPETAAPAEPAAQPAVAALPVANPDFAVSGWQPPLQQEVFAKADFLSEIRDQNGCRFRLALKLEDGLENLRAESQGVACGPDGYAQGEGTLLITRRDGVRIHEFKGAFISGLSVYGKVPQLSVVGFDQRRNLLLRLHSEPASKVHYLLRLDYNSYYGRWDGGRSTLVALTENRELFRDLDNIRRTIDLATTRLDQSAPMIGGISFYAMRDLEQGLSQGNRDFWLYQIQLSRHYRSRQWQYDPQRAENHLFRFEKKEAEQQRLAELQRQREEQMQRELLGRQAEQQLQLYRQLRRETRKPEELYQRILNDVSYEPLGGGDYAALMQGRSRDYAQIVQITGKTDDGWEVEYPYPALLNADDSDQQAGKGWFLVKGKARLDTSRLDEQKLPLTLVSASSLQACSEDGCADLRDPLKLTRHQLGDPSWTPEQARELVAQAWPDRADTQGDDE